MANINENKMAQDIVKKEGKKKEIDIAQAKEALKITLDFLADEWENGNETGVIQLLKKHSL